MTIARPTAPRVAAALPARAGVGFKPEHFDAILAERPDVGFFEIHAENYMGDGGPPHRRLEAIRALYPLSLHGVGLSIGSPAAARPRPSRRVSPRSSDATSRACFPSIWRGRATTTGFLNDLLPLPYTEETLASVVRAYRSDAGGARACACCSKTPRPMSRFAESEIPETEFLAEIARRTGCGLLLDVNNVEVSATNHGFDPDAYLDAFPLERVGEIHLAGYAETRGRAGHPLLDRRPRFAGAPTASGRSMSASSRASGARRP